MEVLRNGKFSLPILTKNLSKGLRQSEENVRNKHGLVTCFGAVGREGVLKTLHEIDKFDTSVEITDGFPYPQIFISPNMVIICGETAIYEKSGFGLQSMLSGLTAGSTWSAVIFHDYVYMSNGKVAVEKNPDTKEYSISELPTAMAICNFNGQVIIGAPDAGIYT